MESIKISTFEMILSSFAIGHYALSADHLLRIASRQIIMKAGNLEDGKFNYDQIEGSHFFLEAVLFICFGSWFFGLIALVLWFLACI